MTAPREIGAALGAARRELPVAEARLLLRHVLDRSHAWLEAHREATLAAHEYARFAELVRRRSAGEPIAYLVGEREFYGRSFEVAPGVLIPRPETELLVELAMARLANCAAPRVLDLGAGSGCVAVSLALELPRATVAAVDVSAVALTVASRNAARHGAKVSLVRGDWLTAFGARRFDCIVGNPPYVAEDDPHLGCGDLRFEPRLALAAGADGLAALRTIVADAASRLAPGGSFLLEHGYDQAAAVAALFARAGYAGIEQARDLAGIVRVTCGHRPLC